MKIEKWLGNPNSARNGEAIIRVEAGEVADIENMVILVDGKMANYGFKVEIYGEEPLVSGAFSSADRLKERTRFYKVFVNRD